jgi:hypothetical protein
MNPDLPRVKYGAMQSTSTRHCQQRHPGIGIFLYPGLAHTNITIQIGTLNRYPQGVRYHLSSEPITSEIVPIPPFCKLLQIVLGVVSTVHVRNMRYVVGRNRQTATGQLRSLIS